MHHSSRYRRFLGSVLLTVLCLGSSVKALAGDITLAWNPNPEPTLAGYKVHYGTASRSYGAFLSVGKVTSYRVTGLGSATYYFAVTAHDLSGNESGFSNEISATVSSTAPTRCDLNGDGNSNALDLQSQLNAILVGNHSATFDINGDSSVNVVDLQVLGNVVLGVTPCP